MSYERERAMYEQDCTEAMIRRRGPRSTGPHPDPLEDAIISAAKTIDPEAWFYHIGDDIEDWQHRRRVAIAKARAIIGHHP